MANNTEKLTLELETRGFPQGDRQIRGTSDAITKSANAALYAGRQHERAFGLMSRGISGLAGMFGISGVAIGVKDLVEAGMHLQEQQAQLRNALTSVGVTGSDAFNKINEAAVKSAESGGFSRDEELKSITQFIQSTHSASQALRDNQAAVNLARQEHISFSEAQHFVAQAVVGNVRRLQQYVGAMIPVKAAEQQLTDSHRSYANMIADQKIPAAMRRNLMLAHELTKAQTAQASVQDRLASGRSVIDTLVNGKGFSTAQSTFARSTQGRAEILKQTFAEVEGSIGMTLLPAINHLLHAGVAVTSFFEKCKPAAVALATAVTALGAVAFGRMLVSGIRYSMAPLLRARAYLRAYGLETQATTVAEEENTVATRVNASATEVKAAIARLAAVSTAEETVAIETQSAANGLLALSIDGVTAAWDLLMASGPQIFLLGLGIAVWELIQHFSDVTHAVGWFFTEIYKGGQISMNWFRSHMDEMLHILEFPFVKAWDGIKWAFNQIKTGWRDLWHWIDHSTPLGAIGQLLGGHLGAAAHAATFGLLHTGGVVTAHHQADRGKHLYTGGPAGTDTVEGWLTPGEGVLDRAAMQVVGSRGLDMLNRGENPFQNQGQITIHPGNVYVQIDGRTIARAVVQYTLERAARGPSSLVGGGLVTGV